MSLGMLTRNSRNKLFVTVIGSAIICLLLIQDRVGNTGANNEISVDYRVLFKEYFNRNTPEESIDEESRLFKTQAEIEVSIFIDVPNAFPWRYCIQEYAGLLATLNCDHKTKEQKFTIVPLLTNDSSSRTQFHLKNHAGHCLIPGTVVHEGVEKMSVKTVKDAENCDGVDGHWIWSEQGQLKWSKGCSKCVQSYKFNTPVQFDFCQVDISYVY